MDPPVTLRVASLAVKFAGRVALPERLRVWPARSPGVFGRPVLRLMGVVSIAGSEVVWRVVVPGWMLSDPSARTKGVPSARVPVRVSPGWSPLAGSEATGCPLSLKLAACEREAGACLGGEADAEGAA
jgi:hypothetical protein